MILSWGVRFSLVIGTKAGEKWHFGLKQPAFEGHFAKLSIGFVPVFDGMDVMKNQRVSIEKWPLTASGGKITKFKLKLNLNIEEI